MTIARPRYVGGGLATTVRWEEPVGRRSWSCPVKDAERKGG